MTVPGTREEECVTACSGSAVVAWHPKSTAQQHRTLDIRHSAEVKALGWLGKGKALAVAGEDRVVNIYSPGGKVVATTPKVHLLPPNAPSITSMVTRNNDVVFGGSDGSIKVAKLPDLKAVTLCQEPGKVIAGLALTPHGHLIAASENGNVLMTKYDTTASGRRPHYLSCRDTEARCSVAASAVSEQVVAGSCSGGINWWDASTGAAGHYIQDQDMSVRLAFQHQSTHCIFSASAAKTLKLWDCRTPEAAHHIGLLKSGSYVAAGPSSHEVALGDAAGVVWLYDLRQPDAPTLRLPCNAGHAVTCIQWTSWNAASTSAEARSARRSGGSSGNTPATPPQAADLVTVEFPTGLSSSTQPRRPCSAGESSLPRAPASTAVGDGFPHQGGHGAEQSGHTLPRVSPEGTASKPPDGVPKSRQHGHYSNAAQADAEVPSAAHIPDAISSGGGAATIAIMQDMFAQQQVQLQKHLDACESRLMARMLSRSGPSEAPAYHTQNIKDHIDRSVSAMKEEVKGWLSDLQTEMVKQFHLAQEDIVDVDSRLTRRTDGLTAAVEQLKLQIQAESESRRRVANLMR